MTVNNFFKYCLILLPTLFLNIKHGANIILFLTFIGSTIFLIRNINLIEKKIITENIGIFIIFISPVSAIAISQLIRGEFYPENWDSPLRFFLCAPIFLAISHGWFLKLNEITITENWLKWSVPISILVTLLVRIFFPSKSWLEHRTTYFVDPLTFCSYTLLFAFLIITALCYQYDKNSIKRTFFYLVTAFVAIYMSATSGGRTGWLNLPVFVLIYWFLIRKKINMLKSLYGLLIFFAAFIIIICFDGQLLIKIKLGWDQLINYKINSLNEDTSIAMRISFYRMGITYFSERPFAGWGDLSWQLTMNRQEFIQFASALTRESPKHGFHNEIITSMVRSGVWGLLASLSLFIVVMYKSIQGVRMKMSESHELISICMLIFIIHLFLSGLFTEITNLTFLSSFIGITISVFLGEKKYLESKITNK